MNIVHDIRFWRILTGVEKAIITLRVDEWLRQEVAEIAAREYRTVSQAGEILLLGGILQYRERGRDYLNEILGKHLLAQTPRGRPPKR